MLSYVLKLPMIFPLLFFTWIYFSLNGYFIVILSKCFARMKWIFEINFITSRKFPYRHANYARLYFPKRQVLSNLSFWLFSTTLSIALRLKLHYVRNTFIYRVLFNEIFHHCCRLMNHESLSILQMRYKNFMSRNACVKMCFLHYTRRETKLTIFTKKLVSYTYFFPPLQ